MIISLFSTSISYSAYTNAEYDLLPGYDHVTVNNVTYGIYDNYAIAVGCNKNATKIKIASKVQSVPVTKIYAHAFFQRNKLVSVNIPDSVKSVGEYCFSYCKSLKSVRLSKNMTYISEGMFSSCKSLKSIYLPKSVYNICEDAFQDCSKLSKINLENIKSIQGCAFYYCKSLKKVKFGNRLTMLGYNVFENSGLTSIYIPKNVKYICTDVGLRNGFYGGDMFGLMSSFSRCKDMKSITVSKSNKYYSSKDGVLYNKKKTILLQYPCNGKRNFIVPKSVIKIGLGAFGYSKIKSVKLGNRVKTVDICAFAYCNSLKTITLDKNVKTISDGVFTNCKSLNRVYMYKGIRKIGDSAFNNCVNLSKGASGIKIPDSVKSIGFCAFYNCKNIKKIILSKKLTTIGDCAFFECKNAKEITVYKSTKKIGDHAFGFIHSKNLELEKVKGFTITGTKGSAAEKYAKKNRFKFKAL